MAQAAAPKPNLILSTVQKLTYEDLHPFLASLKATGYRGEIVFFSSGLSADTSERLKTCGVQLIAFEYFSIRMRRPALLLWPLWRRLFRRLRTFEEKAALARRVFFFMVLRHLLYYEFLVEHSGRYGQIMMTDSRDVFFQGDPFSREYEPGLHVFMEREGVTIGACPHNRQMILEAFGPEALPTLGSYEISCAGVTIGDQESVIAYERRMTELAFDVRTMPMVTGLDQGLHNYIVHQGHFPNLRQHGNGDGGVLTMGALQETEFEFAQDRLIGLRKQRVNILHQYDRHRSVARRLIESLP